MSSNERYCNISVSRHTDPQREEEGAFMNNHTSFKSGTIFKRTLAMCVLLLLVLSLVGCESNQVELRDPNGEGTETLPVEEVAPKAVDSAASTGVKTVSVYDRLPKLNVIYDGETYKAEPTTASWTAIGEDGSGGFCVDGAHPLEFKNGFGLIKIKDGVSEIKLDFEIEPDKVFIRQWFEIYAGDISYADKYYSTPEYDKETKTIRISPNAGFVFEVTATWPEGTVYYGFWISDGKTEGKRTAREDEVRKPYGVPVATETAANSALTGFAVDLFKECVAYEKNKNTLISPLSVFAALSMAGCGATDETLAEMEGVLGMKVSEFCEYSEEFAKSLSGTPEASGKLDVANSVWYNDDPSFKINREFLEDTTEYFNAEVYAAPFDDSTVSDVNSWVKENTDGMIPGIIDELSPEEVLLLINALAFDAEWDEKYYDFNVKDEVFTTAEGEEKIVPFLHGSESAYLEDDKAKGFIKYYKGLKYGFAALLPDEGIDVDEYLAGLNGGKLRGILADPGDYIVMTSMPKIKTEYSVDMKDILSSMGMVRAFDSERAQLNGIGTSESGNISIGKVVHKTFIEVNEEGTRAGAATAVIMYGGGFEPSLTKNVDLNRPYIYMLVDLETNVPIFMGIMRDPEPDTEEKYAQENLGRDEEAVERFLETFPQEYAEIIEEGKAACPSFLGFRNSYLWEVFLAQVKGGKEACVVVATPTDEGDPILKYVHFDGADYWVVYDSHRDHFGTPGYEISKFRFMSEFRTAGYDDYEVVLANESLNSSEERTAYWDRIYAEYYEDEYKEPIDEDGYILAPFTLLYTRWK